MIIPIYITEYNSATYAHKELGYYSADMNEGDIIEIYFNPDTKEIMSIKGNNLAVTILRGMGVLVIGMGILIFINGNRNKKQQ